jgi:hypothetical protein
MKSLKSSEIEGKVSYLKEYFEHTYSYYQRFLVKCLDLLNDTINKLAVYTETLSFVPEDV